MVGILFPKEDNYNCSSRFGLVKSHKDRKKQEKLDENGLHLT